LAIAVHLSQKYLSLTTMKYLLLSILFLPFIGVSQTDNLSLIDEAEKNYLHDATWRYKHRHLFKELGKLINDKDTIYLHEVTKGNPSSYRAYIYTGGDDALYLEVDCGGHPEKCGKPKLTRFKTPSLWSHGTFVEFPPCYFDWFATFDTVFLHQMTEKQSAYAQIPCTVLIRIIKGKVSIFYTELHFNPIHNMRKNEISCPDLQHPSTD
jgi:hypothetical protein